ncbi:MAG: hypothetical protein QOG90_336 [Actinomycetota bacterium]
MAGQGFERTGQPVLLTDEGFGPVRHSATPRAVRADVQGLRAVAVVLVLLDHVFGFPRGGFIGVDVFFCISGFLITGLLVRENERTARFSVREFYARRARRILPMAVLVLVVTDITAKLIFTAVRAHQTLVDSLWAFGFMANVHFVAIGTSYFEAHRPPSAIQQYWSLAVEEQFYLLWPWILLAAFLVGRHLLKGRTRAAVAATATVMVAASFAFCVAYTHSNPTGSYFSAFTRAWELGLGALTMLVAGNVAKLPERTRAIASWTGLGVIVVSAFAIGPFTAFPGWVAAVPVLATAVILAVGPVAGGVGERWALGARPSLYLGDISYSLYLWHWPAIIFANAYFVKGSVAARGSALIGALVLSAITFQLVEEPIRHSFWLSRKPAGYVRDRRRMSEWTSDNERTLLLAAAAAVALVGVQVWTVVSDAHDKTQTVNVSDVAPVGDASGATATTTMSDPFAELVKSSAFATSWGKLDPPIDSLNSAGAPEWIHDHCLDVRADNETRCSYGAPDAPHLAVVLGDSIASSYLPGIRTALGSAYRVQPLTLGECPMIDTPTKASAHSTGLNQRCADHKPWALHEVERLHPELVIVSNSFAFIDALVGGGPAGSSTNADRWRDGTQKTLSALSATGARVVVLGAPPSSENLQECVTVRSTPQDCDREVQPRWLAVRGAESAGANAAHATYVDPLTWFCYRSLCPAVIGSTPVYWDGVHMTGAYSRSLAPQLARVLLPAP